jgi:C4-type Zn-finger protein
MAQHRKLSAKALSALACPACKSCGKPTRFVGLESLPGNDRDDLCTYECSECGNSQADVIPRAATKDSEAFGLRH